jgi:NAD(P)-dependent dehydrogenase (short-subunit alcohol dehydrogenase family)
MPSIFITGSNRGLGLEWARQFAQQNWRVYATCRHPEQAEELRQLEANHQNITVHWLDITNPGQIQTLSAELAGETIDILLNNAGVYLEKFDQDYLGKIDYADWEETFQVNTLGAIRVTEAFADQLARSGKKLVVMITSHMGSIADIKSAGSYAYRSSKAALNAISKGLAFELGRRGIGVLMLHPGWVKTRMGGPGAWLTTKDSVLGMRALIDRFDNTMSGRFFRFDGSEIPW